MKFKAQNNILYHSSNILLFFSENIKLLFQPSEKNDGVILMKVMIALLYISRKV